MLIVYLALSGRMALALVLLAAAAGKTRTFRELAVPLRGLGLPRRLAGTATAGLIGCEALLGALLATGLAPGPTVVATALLLTLFASVAAYALLSGRQIACNCFGSSTSPLGLRTIARALLMGSALAAYASSPVFTARLAWPGLVRVGVTAAALTAAMLLLASWVLALPELARLIRQRRQSTYEVGLVLGTQESH